MSQYLADTKALRYLLASLEPKQVLYAQARANGSVPVAAARIAGYPEPDETAARLEQDLTVRTTIEHLLRVASHDLQVTKNEVINGLKDALHMASSAMEMIAAWREIGRIAGVYAPEVKVNANLTGKLSQAQINGMTTEELERMAGAIDGEATRVEEEDGEVPQTPG